MPQMPGGAARRREILPEVRGQAGHEPQAQGPGNGTGSVYQMPNRTWKAVCVVGWRADADVVITPSSNRTLVCQGRVITKHRFPLPD